MKKSRFTDSPILGVLKQAEAGTPVPELCRTHGISSATFYKWRSKYGGMDASLMARLKALENENRRLKKMYAEDPGSGTLRFVRRGADGQDKALTFPPGDDGEIDRAGARAIIEPRDRRCSQESGDRRLVVVVVVA